MKTIVLKTYKIYYYLLFPVHFVRFVLLMPLPCWRWRLWWAAAVLNSTPLINWKLINTKMWILRSARYFLVSVVDPYILITDPDPGFLRHKKFSLLKFFLCFYLSSVPDLKLLTTDPDTQCNIRNFVFGSGSLCKLETVKEKIYQIWYKWRH